MKGAWSACAKGYRIGVPDKALHAGEEHRFMWTSRLAAVVLVVTTFWASSMRAVRADQSGAVKSVETIAMRHGDIQVRVPEPKSKVKLPFEFGGRAQPHSVVTIEASTSDESTDGDAKNTFRKQTRADERGNFSVEVAVAGAGKYIHVHARSVAPDGSSAHTSQSFAVAH